MNFLLDIDRAGSVFALLFAFAIDEAGEDDGRENPDRQFRDALFQITLGAKIPDPAILKLRDIFRRTELGRNGGNGRANDTITSLARRVADDFSDNREVVVNVLEILLRLSSDDGMFGRNDKARLQEALDVFNLSPAEFESLPERDQLILTECYRAGCGAPRISHELAAHYQILGCAPDATDAELRRRYRALAKQYHPDRHSVLNKLNGSNGQNGNGQNGYGQNGIGQSAGPQNASSRPAAHKPDPSDPRQNFERVHRAYEAIRESRE